MREDKLYNVFQKKKNNRNMILTKQKKKQIDDTEIRGSDILEADSNYSYKLFIQGQFGLLLLFVYKIS